MNKIWWGELENVLLLPYLTDLPVHTWLSNKPLLPISDTFTVKAFWHTSSIPQHLNEKTEYLLGKKRMETS